MHGAVQVLDDSTDQKTRDLVNDKCLEWRERGVNCTCVRRTNRQGYKAGALKEVRCAASMPAPSACRMRGGALPGLPLHGLNRVLAGLCEGHMQVSDAICASQALHLQEAVEKPVPRL